MDWVQSCCQEHRLQVDPSLFRMSGLQLCQLTQQQFCQLAQVKQCGDILYTCLEKLRSGINKSKIIMIVYTVCHEVLYRFHVRNGVQANV